MNRSPEWEHRTAVFPFSMGWNPGAIHLDCGELISIEKISENIRRILRLSREIFYFNRLVTDAGQGQPPVLLAKSPAVTIPLEEYRISEQVFLAKRLVRKQIFPLLFFPPQAFSLPFFQRQSGWALELGQRIRSKDAG